MSCSEPLHGCEMTILLGLGVTWWLTHESRYQWSSDENYGTKDVRREERAMYGGDWRYDACCECLEGTIWCMRELM